MTITTLQPSQVTAIQNSMGALRTSLGAAENFNADVYNLHRYADPRYVSYMYNYLQVNGTRPEDIPSAMERYVSNHLEAVATLQANPSLRSPQLAAQFSTIYGSGGLAVPTAADIQSLAALPPPPPPAPEPMLPLWDARGNSITTYVDPRGDFNTAANLPLAGRTPSDQLTINDVAQYWIEDDRMGASRVVYDPQNLDEMRVVFQYMAEHPQGNALSTLPMESMAYNLLHPDRYEQTRVMVEQIASGQPLPTLTDMFPNMRMLSAEEFEIERLRQVCSGQSGFFSWDTVECAAHRVSNFAYNAGLGIVSAIPSGVALIIDGVDNVPRLFGGETISGREGLLVEDVHNFMQGHYDNAIGVIGLERPPEIDDTDFWFGMAGLVAPALFTGGAAAGGAIARTTATILPNAGRFITPTIAGATVIGAEVASAGVIVAGEVINAPPPPPPLPSANLTPLF